MTIIYGFQPPRYVPLWGSSNGSVPLSTGSIKVTRDTQPEAQVTVPKFTGGNCQCEDMVDIKDTNVSVRKPSMESIMNKIKKSKRGGTLGKL